MGQALLVLRAGASGSARLGLVLPRNGLRRAELERFAECGLTDGVPTVMAKSDNPHR